MLILGLLGIYFDALMVFIKKTSLLFRLVVAKNLEEKDGQTPVRRSVSA